MVNWILLNEVPFKCIFTIIGSFLPSYSWIYRNPPGMWESPLLEWQPLSILHTAPMSPGELHQMHSSSQPPYDGCSFFVFQVNTTVISMAHESLPDGLCLPLCRHLLPSDIITIKIPNYSLSRFLQLPQLYRYAFLFYSTEWVMTHSSTQGSNSTFFFKASLILLGSITCPLLYIPRICQVSLWHEV